MPKKISFFREISEQISLSRKEIFVPDSDIKQISGEKPWISGVKIEKLKVGCLLKPSGDKKTRVGIRIEGTPAYGGPIKVFYKARIKLWDLTSLPSEEGYVAAKHNSKEYKEDYFPPYTLYIFISRTGMNKIRDWVEVQPEITGGKFTPFFRYIK